MDFYQGPITTVHEISSRFDEVVQERVREAVEARPAALVLPMLYSELTQPALPTIARELARCDVLNETYVALTASEEREVQRVVDFFENHDVPARVLWCEGPAVQEELARLKDRGLDFTQYQGKGIAVWMALGAAARDNYAIALHDADVENYSNRVLSRLLFPLVAPELDFYYSKGYYARVTGDRLYGRVVRLFLWPLLDALDVHAKHQSDLTRYLRAFRYPLSGEMAMTSDLALNVRVPTDWGFEIGLLGEVYRNTSAKRICQVDLGLYSHKHQQLGNSSGEGLLKMAHDITTTILRILTESEGTEFRKSGLVSLRILYRRLAQDSVRRFFVDAAANGYAYDRHGEEQAIDAFARIVEHAGRAHLREPGKEQVPDWLRVLSASDDVQGTFRNAARPTARERDRLIEALGAAP